MRKAWMVLAAAAALALPAAAQGKGASKATIEGPGLDKPLTISLGNGHLGGMTLGNLAEHAGFYPALDQAPGLTRRRPAGELGPRYTIVWSLMGPGETTWDIAQDVYPYAKVPVTYMKPGQEYWNGRRTEGGWYVGTAELRSALVAVGLPETAPSSAGFDWSRWIVAALAVSALGAVFVLLTRRTRWLRPEPAS